MGASFNVLTFNTDNQQEIRDQFKALCEEQRQDSHDGFTGTVAELHDIGKWCDLRLTREDAENYLAQHHEKWEDAMAVSFTLTADPDEEYLERVERSEGKVERWNQRFVEAEEVAREAFLARKGSTIGCSGCGSRFNHQTLVSDRFLLALPGTDAKVPACPVCDQHFISKVHRARLVKLQARKTLVARELQEIRRLPVTDKIGWLVGGWCAE